MQKIKIEVCAASVQSAFSAQMAGAHRVELCSSLELGGITPSVATIQIAREFLDLELFVLIRPRPGDFCYTDLEFQTMKREIFFCKTMHTNGKKLDGVVIGILKENGEVDVERVRELVNFAAPLQVTFHRAFDHAADPFLALEKIIETGAHRILTSGQSTEALLGKKLLKALVEKAGDRISIMPGAGVHAGNILELAETTQAQEFHLSGKNVVQSAMTFQHPNFEAAENHFSETDVEKIRAVILKLQAQKDR